MRAYAHLLTSVVDSMNLGALSISPHVGGQYGRTWLSFDYYPRYGVPPSHYRKNWGDHELYNTDDLEAFLVSEVTEGLRQLVTDIVTNARSKT